MSDPNRVDLARTLIQRPTGVDRRASQAFRGRAQVPGREWVEQHILGLILQKRRDEALFIAVLYSNSERVKNLLEEGANVNARNQEGLTPQDWAEIERKNLALELKSAESLLLVLPRGECSEIDENISYIQSVADKNLEIIDFLAQAQQQGPKRLSFRDKVVKFMRNAVSLP